MGFLIGNIRKDPSGFRFADKGSHRNFYNKVRCGFSGHIAAGTVFAVFGNIAFFVFEINKAGNVGVADKNNVSAFAAVTAVGTAGVYIFFTMECNCAVAAVSGLYSDFCGIDKHLLYLRLIFECKLHIAFLLYEAEFFIKRSSGF